MAVSSINVHRPQQSSHLPIRTHSYGSDQFQYSQSRRSRCATSSRNDPGEEGTNGAVHWFSHSWTETQCWNRTIKAPHLANVRVKNGEGLMVAGCIVATPLILYSRCWCTRNRLDSQSAQSESRMYPPVLWRHRLPHKQLPSAERNNRIFRFIPDMNPFEKTFQVRICNWCKMQEMFLRHSIDVSLWGTDHLQNHPPGRLSASVLFYEVYSRSPKCASGSLLPTTPWRESENLRSDHVDRRLLLSSARIQNPPKKTNCIQHREEISMDSSFSLLSKPSGEQLASIVLMLRQETVQVQKRFFIRKTAHDFLFGFGRTWKTVMSRPSTDCPSTSTEQVTLSSHTPASRCSSVWICRRRSKQILNMCHATSFSL